MTRENGNIFQIVKTGRNNKKYKIMKASIVVTGSNIGLKISNTGNSAALLLEWISVNYKDRVTIQSTIKNTEEENFLFVVIFLGSTSNYSINYDELAQARNYINNNI
jgi:hypothetical protein